MSQSQAFSEQALQQTGPESRRKKAPAQFQPYNPYTLVFDPINYAQGDNVTSQQVYLEILVQEFGTRIAKSHYTHMPRRAGIRDIIQYYPVNGNAPIPTIPAEFTTIVTPNQRAQWKYRIVQQFRIADQTDINYPLGSLIDKRSKSECSLVTALEESYNIIASSHESGQKGSHLNRDDTWKQVKSQTCSIPKDIVAKFVNACPRCKKRIEQCRNGHNVRNKDEIKKKQGDTRIVSVLDDLYKQEPTAEVIAKIDKFETKKRERGISDTPSPKRRKSRPTSPAVFSPHKWSPANYPQQPLSFSNDYLPVMDMASQQAFSFQTTGYFATAAPAPESMAAFPSYDNSPAMDMGINMSSQQAFAPQETPGYSAAAASAPMAVYSSYENSPAADFQQQQLSLHTTPEQTQQQDPSYYEAPLDPSNLNNLPLFTEDMELFALLQQHMSEPDSSQTSQQEVQLPEPEPTSTSIPQEVQQIQQQQLVEPDLNLGGPITTTATAVPLTDLQAETEYLPVESLWENTWIETPENDPFAIDWFQTFGQTMEEKQAHGEEQPQPQQ